MIYNALGQGVVAFEPWSKRMITVPYMGSEIAEFAPVMAFSTFVFHTFDCPKTPEAISDDMV